ncbi:RING zinc finger-containing protein [Heterostelium album PN500]|uniref:RING zinc finger-containing protein n=1 Tax=Heterostelium pallidum (strain ATCC 26659 / Pp 5 / PN500) TaxID=670386 RepID=D3BH37_HETP5|nr:RING zinc finger-containing protein [Heterostelium album PN500]EFA79421.1 RING zinc finger-containing protein [Heterostelium album PN500]|eukprot:XP_020431542.1 RING zinc finger-containing protein [Heterostelium album PN500]
MRLEWKRLGVGGSPEARWGHVTVSLSNGAFLVFGGNGNKTFNDLTLYNSGSNSWSKIEPQGNPPAPRYGHSATPFGQQILIYGGRANSKPFSDVTVLQHQGGDRFKWLKSQHQHKSPEGRAGHTAIAYNNQLIVFGGHNSSRNKYYNSVLTFNIDTGNWDQPTCDGAVPPARGSHSTFQVGNHMYVFGGFDGKKYYNDLHCLDLECKGNSPKPRSGHSSTLMGDRLVIFGGCGSDSNFLNDVHLLSLDDMRWEQPVMAGMENPHPRFRHTANSMGQNKVFIYAGTGSASEDQLLTMPSTTTTSTATASNNNATANQSTTSPPPPTTTTTSTTATSIPTSTTTTTTNNPVVITTTGNNNGNGINNTGGTTPPNSSAASIMMTTTSLITTTTTTTTTSSSSSTSPSPSPSPLSSSPPNTSTTTHQSPIQITSDSFQSGFIVQQPQTQQQQHSQPQQQQQQQQQQHSPSHQSSHSHQQQIINISPERPRQRDKVTEGQSGI